MNKLLFVDPLSENSDYYARQIKLLFENANEVSKWNLWFQEGPGLLGLCVQEIECKNPKNFMNVINPEIKLDPVLDLAIEANYTKTTHDLCYALPILPEKVEEHRAYCRAAMEENREKTIETCKKFGIVHLTKWIQESPKGAFVVYSQKMTHTPEESREKLLALKNDPDALEGTKLLREQTGVAFENLCPKTKIVSLM
jgi:hypothetical protein